MKFQRYEVQKGRREWTPRKLAAAARAARKERDAVPLFPELARIHTTEDRVAELDLAHAEFAAKHRALRSLAWRKARRQLAEMPAIRRLGFIRLWNLEIYPLDPSYLLNLIHCLRHGSPWAQLREQHQLAEVGRRWRAERGWAA